MSKLNRTEQLYRLSLAKARAREHLSSKDYDQRQYEEQKNECTFKPKLLNKVPKSSSLSPFRMRGPTRKQDEDGVDRSKSKEKCRKLREESQKRAIERAREAARRRHLVEVSRKTGTPYSTLDKSPNAKSKDNKLSKQQSLKQEQLTDRLSQAKEAKKTAPCLKNQK